MNEATGYERLRVVVNTSGEVLEFFKFMGYLLLSGSLGECVSGAQLPWGTECTIHININRSRFGEEVLDFLAKDRDQNLKEQEKFPLLVVPRWEYWYDGQTIRLYLKACLY